MNPAKAQSSKGEFDPRLLLSVLTATKKGDFSARMPLDWIGIHGQIADTLNDIIDTNDKVSRELDRVSKAVGKEGKLAERASFGPVSGAWAQKVESVNALISDLARPTMEMARVIGAVAKGDLNQTMILEVDGKAIQGEFMRTGQIVNTMVDQLGSFASEVTRVAREVGTDGKLGGQADVRGVAGTWKDLTDNVNMMAGNLTGQVRNIADVTTAVANGDLSKKITVEVKGEILELKNTINTMVDQLGSFASEVTRVAREVGTDGKLGGQADVRGVAGTWKDLTDNVNMMAGNLTGQVRNIAEVTTAVANGDLSKKITVEVKGEILELKNTINTMVDQLGSFASEVTRVAREVGTDGKLGGQADVRGVAGTWKDLTDNVNMMAGNLTGQVRNIAEVTTAVANGDLSKKITVDVKGEILELKNTINTMVDQLGSFASEVTRVAREVGTDGKLGGQADVRGVAGTWKDLTDNVNMMAGNLTGQVRNIAEVTTAVANGDLSKKITVDVKGEILELKDTINTMVDQLNAFASEVTRVTRVTRVAREVGTDGKLGDQVQVKGVAGTWKDIIDRGVETATEFDRVAQQAEEALLKAGALQNAIFNSANFSSIATDAKGVIQIFNVGAERMLGYTAADVMDKITPADISDPQEVIARAKALSVELGTPITPGFEALVFKASRGIEDIYELTYIRKDGSRFPAVVSVTALRDAQGAIIGYLLIGTDNTARKQVEDERMKLDQRLRDQHFYTRSLIESNIDALMTTDPRGIITDVNKQTEALTGCTRDELIGAPFKNYFTDSDRAEAGINRVLSEGRVTNYELTARTRDGKLTVVSYNATTFHDRDRRLQGVCVAARDMTELKRIEQALQQKNVELEGASRLKSEFLANMSHELRTPLNAIIGFSEILGDGLLGELTDAQQRFIGDIFGSGTHLLSLINDILDLSKVEAGKMTLDLETVQLSSLFANSLSIIREKAANRHIRLNVEAPEELGSIQADARKVKQIVYNLLSNAVKFSGDHGQVTLHASRVPRGEVGHLAGSWNGRTFPLSESAFAEFIKISVTDRGIGISLEGLEQLFRPFSQIDSGLARKFEGTGLGLAMVRQLVELHDGAVMVESAVGEGSCFTVWLPLRAPAADALTPAKGPAAHGIAAPSGARMALMVEDDFKSAELIRVHLEAEGFKVLHAASAEAALVLAVQQPLSLITLDILLPGMDGWKLLARLKQVSALRYIPVVIISIVADRNKGFALGAAAVMQKPISRLELYESLVALGLFPVSQGRTLTVLVVDDDPDAVELIAVRILGLASSVLRAYGGREAIDAARRELPDLIVLDLMMPEVNGFDVVGALNERSDTARIPILVVTDEQITAEDRVKLTGSVTTIMEKAELDRDRLTAEIRRALPGRQAVP